MQHKNFKNSAIIIAIGTLLQTSCALFPDPEPMEKPSEVFLQLGVRYMDINKLELAKENLLKSVEIDPENARAYSALGYLYERINRFEDARKNYETAVTIDPEDIGIQNNFGRFLCERRQFDKGQSYLTKAATNMLNDHQWMAMTNLARCHLGQGDRPKAESMLRQALELNPRYPAALFEMQKISYQIGDYRAAEDYLQRFLAESNHTAETLWIGIQTEQALGNSSLANEYRRLLMDKFPNSNEAKQISGIRE